MTSGGSLETLGRAKRRPAPPPSLTTAETVSEISADLAENRAFLSESQQEVADLIGKFDAASYWAEQGTAEQFLTIYESLPSEAKQQVNEAILEEAK